MQEHAGRRKPGNPAQESQACGVFVYAIVRRYQRSGRPDEGPGKTDVTRADDPCRGRISEPAGAAARVASGLATIRVAADTGTADQLIADLFRGHRLALIRLALALVGDSLTAEDIVQDAFTGLYRAMPGLRDPGKALGYLRTSAINGCRSVPGPGSGPCGRAVSTLRRLGRRSPPCWRGRRAAWR